MRQQDIWFKLSCGSPRTPEAVIREALRIRIKTKDMGFMLAGCYHDELIWHIERQFPFAPMFNGKFPMNWENKYMWHVDHIIPVGSFEQDGMRECWHWTNLRPLWEFDNISKSDKIQHSWHVPFSVRKFWIPADTFIGPDGLTHHNSERGL